MTEEPKDCMFQYAVSHRYANYESIEDTGLISLSEAKELWYKHLPDYIRRMETEDGSPEMAIWVGCSSDIDYHKTLAHIDDDNVIENGRVYEVTRKEIVI